MKDFSGSQAEGFLIDRRGRFADLSKLRASRLYGLSPGRKNCNN
jgi:hypothetical protein